MVLPDYYLLYSSSLILSIFTYFPLHCIYPSSFVFITIASSEMQTWPCNALAYHSWQMSGPPRIVHARTIPVTLILATPGPSVYSPAIPIASMLIRKWSVIIRQSHITHPRLVRPCPAQECLVQSHVAVPCLSQASMAHPRHA